MKMIDDELIRYLTGDMLPGEKSAFEEKLSGSAELLQQKADYEKMMSEIKSPEPEVNEAYFNNLLPGFRARLDSRRQRKKTLTWSLTFSSAAAVLLLLILFLPVSQQVENYDEVIKGMDSNEISQLVTEMEIDVHPSVEENVEAVTEIYVDELSITPESAINSEMLTDADIFASLTEEETELIYNELINKELFRH